MTAVRRKRETGATPTAPQSTGSAVFGAGTPKWVDEMHQHYYVHGFYRALDLQRVLGDPGESVIADVSVGFGVNHQLKK